MTPITVTIPLPDELAKEAEQIGLFTPSYEKRWVDMIEREIRRMQALERLGKKIDELQAMPDEDKPTLEGIEREIAAYRAEKYK